VLTEACRCVSRPLTVGSAWNSWTFDPFAVLVIALAAYFYVRAVQRLRRQGGDWPVSRSAFFGLGLLTIAAVTLWWVGAYAHTLFWVYTVQIMMLLVISPALLMFGRPVTLARQVRPAAHPSWVARLADSGPIKLLSKPAVGPLLLPVVTLLVFFTAIFPASLSNFFVYQLVHLVLLVTGLVMALPLADEGGLATSMGIAAGILFAFLELLADAIPGIAIRLRTSILAYDHYRAVGRTWGPSLLRDQQLGGSIVWFLAEIIDLPVLALLVFRWIRADEREAVIIDQRLDEQQAAQASEGRQALEAEQRPPTDHPGPDLQRPWWETDAAVFDQRREAALRRPVRRADRRADRGESPTHGNDDSGSSES
jgi:putative membrane protein